MTHDATWDLAHKKPQPPPDGVGVANMRMTGPPAPGLWRQLQLDHWGGRGGSVHGTPCAPGPPFSQGRETGRGNNTTPWCIRSSSRTQALSAGETLRKRKNPAFHHFRKIEILMYKNELSRRFEPASLSRNVFISFAFAHGASLTPSGIQSSLYQGFVLARPFTTDPFENLDDQGS